MFRFNNPDALLVLLLVLGAYALVRALEAGRTGWLVAAAVFIGFGFLTKMMQAFLVVPGFALTYLVAAPVAARRRIGQVLAAGPALVVSAGWWVAIVELWPAAERPYVGGSQTNSVLELISGYNGFGRLTGNEIGSVGRGGWAGGPRGPGGGMSGGGGVRQLFDWSMGSQIAWLLPAALLFLLTLLWVGRRMPRTDRPRASMLLWGGWLLVTGAVLSYAQGIIHPYYTVALAPAIGALVGIGAVTLWQLRSGLLARAVLATGLAGTAVWAFVLLDRAPGWQPWLRVVVLIAGLVCAVVLAAPASARSRVGLLVAAAGVVVGLASPSAYALDTAATPHRGALPSGGRCCRLEHGGRFPARHRAPGDAGRRLQRQRPVADAGPVPAARGAGRDPLLHRWWWLPGQHGGSSSSRQIADWVQQNFTSTTVGGATVYNPTERAERWFMPSKSAVGVRKTEDAQTTLIDKEG